MGRNARQRRLVAGGAASDRQQTHPFIPEVRRDGTEVQTQGKRYGQAHPLQGERATLPDPLRRGRHDARISRLLAYGPVTPRGQRAALETIDRLVVSNT
jgi:hypothetical protein